MFDEALENIFNLIYFQYKWRQSVTDILVDNKRSVLLQKRLFTEKTTMKRQYGIGFKHQEILQKCQTVSSVDILDSEGIIWKKIFK